MESITLVVRTYNAMSYWPDLLAAIGKQDLSPDELLVVDSESTDGTQQAVKASGARMVTISQDDFTHARSTNLAFETAKGDIVAMLSQDALPADSRWLTNLVAPLNNSQVAAVFGRQVPRPRCFPLEAWELEASYPATKPSRIPYSNVNSAARKKRWEEIPFDETVLIAEDRFWARKIQEAGYSVEYEPQAKVIHSHDYSFRQAYTRCRQEAQAIREQEGLTYGLGVLTKSWPKRSLLDGWLLAREGKIHYWPKAVGYRFAQFAGMAAGGK
jgi:rhamnosyltransferase